MNLLKRQKINLLAEIVREACELQSPIDLEKATKCLGGKLEIVEEADFEAKVEKIEEGFKITIAKEENEGRQRFSIAHELGHLFLHMGYLIDVEKWKSAGTYTDSVYYRYGHNTEEYEAHEFAAAFLMPGAEFEEVAENNSEGDMCHIEPIAKHFKVTVSATINRGRWLGLFNWD